MLDNEAEAEPGFYGWAAWHPGEPLTCPWSAVLAGRLGSLRAVVGLYKLANIWVSCRLRSLSRENRKELRRTYYRRRMLMRNSDHIGKILFLKPGNPLSNRLLSHVPSQVLGFLFSTCFPVHVSWAGVVRQWPLASCVLSVLLFLLCPWLWGA